MLKPMTESEKKKLESFLNKDTEQAVIERATKFRATESGKSSSDPLKNIPPSLLSADDIARYYKETGMIYPFHFQKRKTIEKPEGIHRLKSASYEGCIGDTAYIFDPDQNDPKSILSKKSEFLTFPANSIVFVESDLYFRLPPFIAVRFNLQIRHVHRGLLLGTGPLVDPGYWGKLCIPIHNLTDEDYIVPLEEGLIWIEFTKTTSRPKLGEPPSNTNLDHIEAAISKSSHPYRAELVGASKACQWMRKKRPSKVGIRSSIGSVFREAQETARSSEKAANSSRKWARGFSILGIAALVSSFYIMYDLWMSYRDAVANYEDRMRSLSTTTTREISSFTTKLTNSSSAVEAIQSKVDEQADTIMELQQKLDALLKNQ